MTIPIGTSLRFLMALVHTCETTTLCKCALIQSLSASKKKATRRKSTKPTTSRLQVLTIWCSGNPSLIYDCFVLQTTLLINGFSSMLGWQRSVTQQITRTYRLIRLLLSTFIQSTCSHFKSGASRLSPLYNHLTFSIL